MVGRFHANAQRLEADLAALAEFGKVGPTAITRLAFTDADNAAYRHLERVMQQAGLSTRYDAFGNLFGARPGSDAAAKPVVTGSHVDGPPNGGIYDGVVGILSALEACRLLDERGLRTRHPIEVVAVRAEHLDRFGISCLGSRAFGGKLTQADLDRLKDGDGNSLRAVLKQLGYRPDDLAEVCLRDRIAVWLELHVEQGKVLEELGHRVGVVTAIAGPTRHRVRVTGMADHSGATPMSIRKDALCGAAEMILDLERLSRATADCVGTVGIARAEPGAVHTIPGLAEFFVDIRGVRAADKRKLVGEFRAAMERRAAARGLGLAIETFVDEDPVPCAPGVVDALTRLCEAIGADHLVMPSGAGHDAQHVAAVAEVGMLFVPSAKGIAHTPEEFTAIEDIAYGTEVFAEALLRFAGEAAA